MQDTIKDITIIRLPELKKKLGGVHRTTILRWERLYGFPPRIKVGAGTVGWDLNLVNKWLSSRGKNI